MKTRSPDNATAASAVQSAEAARGKARPAALWNNLITMLGAMIVAVSVCLILTFVLFSFISPSGNPYLDIVGYMVLPALLVIGLIICPVGILVAHLRRRMGMRRLVLSVRSTAIFMGVSFFLILPIVGVSSYQGYHYTESTQFCANVCHAVMEPQGTTYEMSPHARVSCAECHIGTGASPFVKSKLSGLRQVYAALAETYSRPIAPAINELRPARETCEQCHWPQRFFGDQLVTIQQFGSDEANTSIRLRMHLKTGGSDRSTGPPSGIHWHMSLGFKVEYVAVDEHLQDIPWVRIIDDTTGEERIYRSDGKPHDSPPPDGTRRTVDCMDCHNRPAHKFRSPDRTVDAALSVDSRLQSLPFAKREAVRALVRPYTSKADGLAGVAEDIRQFYSVQQPENWSTRRADIERLEAAAVGIYRANFFPEMNVNWRTYPDNIGHKFFPGCFRCHDDKHVDAAGNAISQECAACHEFLPTGGEDDSHSLVRASEFVHPYSLEGPHATMRCDRCHTGGIAPQASCEGCHEQQHEFRAGMLAAFDSPELPPDPMLEVVDCEGCHDLSQPTNIDTIDLACMDCHEDEEDRFEGMLASWRREVDQMFHDAEVHTDDAGRRLLKTLRDAGPMHNIEATRILVRSLTSEPGSSTAP